MAITDLSNSDYSALFKRKYGKLADNLYLSGAVDPVEARIVKTFNFKGSQMNFPVKVSFGGGTSYGTLGTAKSTKHVDVTLTRKSAYCRLNLDRETIKASNGNEGAFIEATKEETTSKLTAYNREQAVALFNDGSGCLGQFGAAATGTAAAPVITILNTGAYRFRPMVFEVGQIVEIGENGQGAPDASKFEITDVNVSTRAVTLSRLNGSGDLTGFASATHNVFVEGSNPTNDLTAGVAPTGLLAVQNFTSGSLYGASYQRRWKPGYTDSTGGLITIDKIVAGCLQLEKEAGEGPDLVATSYVQYLKLLNQLEDNKRQNVTLKSRPTKGLVAQASFSGISIDTLRGPVTVIPSRFVHEDTVMLLNTKKVDRRHVGKPEWFSDDGTVLLRMEDLDAYEARYGAYYENFINPLYFGFITGLST